MIANSTSAAALCHALYGGEAADWAGPGTGLDTPGVAAKAAVGIAGNSVTAPVHPDTVLATPIMTSTPHPIGVSAAASKPKSISRKAAIAQGITHNAVTGTAMRLAARP